MLPTLGSPDRLMRRFQRTGDPRALGRLFDLTAPELLRAALWLAGNRADAEDLLQRTFLTVIEARANYDPQRRAMPWLLGVLGNHARKLHVRRERDQARRYEPVPLGEPDPQAHAIQEEVCAVITRLRGELGTPYREVLDLHLGHGLAAGEIATRLGRPAGTVRTQLVRGLDLLRRRLPPSLLAPMLALTVLAPGGTAQGLAVIRRNLLRAAGAVAPAAAAATTLVKPTAIATAILMLAATGSLAIWFHRGDAADAALPPGPAQAVWRADADPEPQDLVPAVRQHGGTVAASTAEGGARDRTRGHAHGIVLDADGSPVPFAALWLSLPTDRGAYAPAGTADAEGRFAVAIAERCELGASAPGMVASFVHTVMPAQEQELELRLRGPSSTVQGVVYDHRGEPLPGAHVKIGIEAGFRVRNATRDEAFYPPRRATTTGAKGEFRLDVEPGAADVIVYARGHSPHRAGTVVGSSGENRLAIRLQQGARLHGTVRTAAGQPIADASVATRGPDAASIRTAPDGSYELGDVAAGTVEVKATAGDAVYGETVRLAPGERRRCDFVLHPAPLVRGIVLDARGTPLAGLHLVAGAPQAEPSVLATTAADGRFAFADVPAVHGDGGIVVRLGDVPLARFRPTIAAGEFLSLVVDDGQLPSAHLTGRVCDDAGAPVHVLLRVTHHAFLDPFYGASGPDGAFDLGPLPPGDYTVVAETKGYGRVPRRVSHLQAAERRDLGTWTLPSAVPIELTLRGSGAGTRRLVQFAREDGLVAAHAMSEGDRVQAELPPGRYAASIVGGAEDGSSLQLEVTAGQAATRGVLQCAATARAMVRIDGLTPAPGGRRIELVLRDADGAFVDARECVPQATASLQFALGIPPGSYRIECRTTDGLGAVVDLEVVDRDTRPSLHFELR